MYCLFFSPISQNLILSQCSSIAGNIVALGIMKYFKVEPVVEAGSISGGANLTQFDSVKWSFEPSACVQMMPNHQATLVAGGHGAAMEVEELSHNGFMVLIAFIATCHVIATMILYYGITGQYKKATVTDCGKSNKEKVKQALKDMLTQISLKKQVQTIHFHQVNL